MHDFYNNFRHTPILNIFSEGAGGEGEFWEGNHNRDPGGGELLCKFLHDVIYYITTSNLACLGAIERGILNSNRTLVDMSCVVFGTWN